MAGILEVHELSIALSMIEMASGEAARLGDARVTALHLKLGPLSGVVKQALTFSYDVACEGTALEGSELIIEDVPVVIHCSGCNKRQVIETIQSLRCPECGEPSAEIIQGRELILVALELDQAEELVT